MDDAIDMPAELSTQDRKAELIAVLLLYLHVESGRPKKINKNVFENVPKLENAQDFWFEWIRVIINPQFVRMDIIKLDLAFAITADRRRADILSLRALLFFIAQSCVDQLVDAIACRRGPIVIKRAPSAVVKVENSSSSC